MAVFARRDLAVLPLDLRADALGAGLELFHAGTRLDRDALLGKRLFEEGRHILHRHDPVEHSTTVTSAPISL